MKDATKITLEKWTKIKDTAHYVNSIVSVKNPKTYTQDELTQLKKSLSDAISIGRAIVRSVCTYSIHNVEYEYRRKIVNACKKFLEPIFTFITEFEYKGDLPYCMTNGIYATRDNIDEAIKDWEKRRVWFFDNLKREIGYSLHTNYEFCDTTKWVYKYLAKIITSTISDHFFIFRNSPRSFMNGIVKVATDLMTKMGDLERDIAPFVEEGQIVQKELLENIDKKELSNVRRQLSDLSKRVNVIKKSMETLDMI